jgi:hypothetical protein
MALNYSREAKRCLAGPQIPPPSMEPEGSLPCPENPVTALYPESVESSPQCHVPRFSDSS